MLEFFGSLLETLIFLSILWAVAHFGGAETTHILSAIRQGITKEFTTKEGAFSLVIVGIIAAVGVLFVTKAFAQKIFADLFHLSKPSDYISDSLVFGLTFFTAMVNMLLLGIVAVFKSKGD